MCENIFYHLCCHHQFFPNRPFLWQASCICTALLGRILRLCKQISVGILFQHPVSNKHNQNQGLYITQGIDIKKLARWQLEVAHNQKIMTIMTIANTASLASMASLAFSASQAFSASLASLAPSQLPCPTGPTGPTGLPRPPAPTEPTGTAEPP